MRLECGKTPIQNSVYLTWSHRIVPLQWPSSQIAMGPQRFTGQAPLQEHKTFLKEHLVHEYFSKTCTENNVLSRA